MNTLRNLQNKKSTLNLAHIVVLLLIFLQSAVAEESKSSPLFQYQDTKFKNHFSVGASYHLLDASTISFSAIGFDFGFFRPIKQSKLEVVGRVTPLIRSEGGLAGIIGSTGLKYFLLGERSSHEEVKHSGTPVLYRENGTPKTVVSIEAGINVTPLFGSGSTAVFSGITLGSHFEFNSFLAQTEFGIRYSQLSLGTRSLNIFSLSISRTY